MLLGQQGLSLLRPVQQEHPLRPSAAAAAGPIGPLVQVFIVARQALSLVAGDAIDVFLLGRLRLLRQEHTIARVIQSIQVGSGLSTQASTCLAGGPGRLRVVGMRLCGRPHALLAAVCLCPT